MNKIKTCYVAAPGDTNLDPLRGALYERGISLLSPNTQSGSMQAASDVTTVMRRADLVIGILSKERRSDWTLFELGVAWSTGRQILLVVPPGAALGAPLGLDGVLQVRANPSNIAAITFAVDQLQAVPDSTRRHETPPLPKPTAVAVGDLKVEARRAIEQKDAAGFERVVHEALKRAQLDAIVSESTSPAARADFAVWVDELTGAVGNPLLIEVKLEIPSPKAWRDFAARFSSVISASGTRFGLLLYGVGPEPHRTGLSMPFNVLALPVSSFLDSLTNQSFASLVTQLRNQRVHGADR